jgi:hypothetical protein
MKKTSTPGGHRALDRTTAVFDVRYAFDVTGPLMSSAVAEFAEPPLGLVVRHWQ